MAAISWLLHLSTRARSESDSGKLVVGATMSLLRKNGNGAWLMTEPGRKCKTWSVACLNDCNDFLLSFDAMPRFDKMCIMSMTAASS